MSAMSRHYVLAAGGTGGHMIPAHALAEELLRARPSRRADHRRSRRAHPRPVRQRPGPYPARRAAERRAGRLAQGGARRSSTGRAMALRLYETFLPVGGDRLRRLSGASRRCSRRGATGIPTLIHEQNAVLGRVNRLMAGRVDAIATAYHRASQRLPAKARGQGPSGRQSGARRGAGAARPALPGARPRTASSGCWSPAAARAPRSSPRWCPRGWPCCPSISAAGCRSPSNAAPRISSRCARAMPALGIPADLATYLPDLPERLAWSHLVIARAGASTIAELTAAGPPGDPGPAAERDRRPPDLQRPRDGQGRRRADDRAGQVHRRSSSPSRCRSSASSPPRSPRPRARAKAVGRPDAAQRPRRPGRADRPRSRRRSRVRARRTCCGRCRERRRRHEGRRHRHRHDPFRRHRRHRHVGHRRGDAHISATRCRARTSPKAMSSRACASAASRSRSATARTISATPRWW